MASATDDKGGAPPPEPSGDQPWFVAAFASPLYYAMLAVLGLSFFGGYGFFLIRDADVPITRSQAR